MNEQAIRPVSVYTRPGFYPGPVILAACATAAGFNQDAKYPAVTDVQGKHWTPSGLQIILALAGAESSGNAFAYHQNASDGSMDHGIWQINDKAHPEWFGPAADSSKSAYNPWDCAVMAWLVHVGANYAWTPWVAYKTGAYLKWRDPAISETWMSWAAHGIAKLNTLTAAGQTLLQIATADLDEPA